MQLKFKHYSLIIGLCSIIISFLFVAREQHTYQALLVGGFFLSLISYIIILFSKDSVKIKTIWTFLIFLAIIVQWNTERLFIKYSYLIYLNTNYPALIKVNSLLKNKPSNISIINDRITDGDSLLTPTEKTALIKLKKELGVYIISKFDNGISYGLWGMLDVRLGIIYWTNDKKPDKQFHYLKDKWLYH